MKRLLCFVLVFCMAVALFCGCSNGNTDHTTESTLGGESTSSSQSTSSESTSSSETEE